MAKPGIGKTGKRAPHAGTLRLGGPESQRRWAQSRRKSGRVGMETKGAGAEDGALAAGIGSFSEAAADAARACHSFWNPRGREAGATGARLPAGRAQQSGVGHFECRGPQQRHTTGAAASVVSWRSARPACEDTITHASMPSSSKKVLAARADIRHPAAAAAVLRISSFAIRTGSNRIIHRVSKPDTPQQANSLTNFDASETTV